MAVHCGSPDDLDRVLPKEGENELAGSFERIVLFPVLSPSTNTPQCFSEEHLIKINGSGGGGIIIPASPSQGREDGEIVDGTQDGTYQKSERMGGGHPSG